MNKFPKKIMLTGIPLFAVVILCGIFFYAGSVLLKTAQPSGKYLTAEKSAVILQAVLSHQGDSPEQLQKEITDPILAVLQKYIDQGYVVIDTGKDENGNMAIAAIPAGTRDITAELNAVIVKNKGP